MENVKKQTEKSWIFLGLAAGVLVMSAGIWGLFFMNKSYSPNAKAYVDGRIETGDSEIDKAYEKFFLSEPAYPGSERKSGENHPNFVPGLK